MKDSTKEKVMDGLVRFYNKRSALKDVIHYYYVLNLGLILLAFTLIQDVVGKEAFLQWVDSHWSSPFSFWGLVQYAILILVTLYALVGYVISRMIYEIKKDSETSE